jgi:hypothetical protein
LKPFWLEAARKAMRCLPALEAAVVSPAAITAAVSQVATPVVSFETMDILVSSPFLTFWTL